MYSNVLRNISNHIKCRNGNYPCNNGAVVRFPVEDSKVSWDINWSDYDPPYYTSNHLLGQPWADPELKHPNVDIEWNALKGSVNRCSHHGPYKVINDYPLNPGGRTGLRGRGILGRWGPNHAADPIVTRWKRDGNHSVNFDSISKKPVLQFVAIKRRDCGEWALPGGMVDPGEVISQTLRREFLEEAYGYLEMNTCQKKELLQHLNDFFKNGVDIYKGYVDDIRNTDNAWIETVAQSFHDESGVIFNKFKLQAGDDAKDVSWIDISRDLSLYASHLFLIELVVNRYNGHW